MLVLVIDINYVLKVM